MEDSDSDSFVVICLNSLVTAFVFTMFAFVANGNPPSHSSSSHSRRDSSGTVPKCDNVTKYPDKKQIEDKLTQIREYIRVTSSLMATMKNTDDQVCFVDFCFLFRLT